MPKRRDVLGGALLAWGRRWGLSRVNGAARRVMGGLNKVSGFALSIVLLAAASLAVIPAMIRADGDAAWGSIAVGQSIGGIAAVAIGYGWGISGPARIAIADASRRRTEYLESVKVRLLLAVPAAGLAAVAATFVTPVSPLLGALGAISAATVGLSANWYFAGTRRPYVMLLMETVPRVMGTIVGIVMMAMGAGATAGLLCVTAGMLIAFLGSCSWILLSSRRFRSQAPRTASVGVLLARQRHGLVSSLGSSVYVAAPLVIVSLVAPAAQPVFALVDKVQRQVSVALVPLVTVLQGWVPHIEARESAARANRALAGGATLGVLLGVGIFVFGPLLIDFLGHGSIEVSTFVILLMAGYVAINFFESVVAKVTLASLGRLKLAAHATSISALIGLPLVAAGAIFWGAAGALAAVLFGLIARTIVEATAAYRTIGRQRRSVAQIPEDVDA